MESGVSPTIIFGNVCSQSCVFVQNSVMFDIKEAIDFVRKVANFVLEIFHQP